MDKQNTTCKKSDRRDVYKWMIFSVIVSTGLTVSIFSVDSYAHKVLIFLAFCIFSILADHVIDGKVKNHMKKLISRNKTS